MKTKIPKEMQEWIRKLKSPNKLEVEEIKHILDEIGYYVVILGGICTKRKKRWGNNFIWKLVRWYCTWNKKNKHWYHFSKNLFTKSVKVLPFIYKSQKK